MKDFGLTNAHITEFIHHIRGHRVILDSDLARLYDVEVKQLKRQVRRNLNRFPQDFMFTLTKDEYERLRCHIGTLKARGTHAKYLPYAFTEQGVAMLSSVLNSPRAIQVNIAIIRVFVKLREVLAANRGLAKKLADIERRLARHDAQFGDQANQIRVVFDAIHELMAPETPPRKRIGFTPSSCSDIVPFGLWTTLRKR